MRPPAQNTNSCYNKELLLLLLLLSLLLSLLLLLLLLLRCYLNLCLVLLFFELFVFMLYRKHQQGPDQGKHRERRYINGIRAANKCS